MTEVSCYAMDLYCSNAGEYGEKAGLAEGDIHNFREFPHNYIGPTRGYCAKDARLAGWIFHRDGTRTCPKCNTKKSRRTK